MKENPWTIMKALADEIIDIIKTNVDEFEEVTWSSKVYLGDRAQESLNYPVCFVSPQETPIEQAGFNYEKFLFNFNITVAAEDPNVETAIDSSGALAGEIYQYLYEDRGLNQNCEDLSVVSFRPNITEDHESVFLALTQISVQCRRIL